MDHPRSAHDGRRMAAASDACRSTSRSRSSAMATSRTPSSTRFATPASTARGCGSRSRRRCCSASRMSVDEQLRRLKSRGVTIVLDDFGVDSSQPAARSSRSACDAVKLDRTLIERVGEEPEMEKLRAKPDRHGASLRPRRPRRRRRARRAGAFPDVERLPEGAGLSLRPAARRRASLPPSSPRTCATRS